MIADEADRDQQQVAVAIVGELLQRVLDGRAEPWFGARALALERPAVILRLQLLELRLRNFQVFPRYSGEQRRVLAPDVSRAILMRYVHIFSPLGLDYAVRPIDKNGDKVRLVVPKIRLDG